MTIVVLVGARVSKKMRKELAFRQIFTYSFSFCVANGTANDQRLQALKGLI